MERHSINLKNVISHGKITIDFADDMLHILTQSQNTHFHEFGNGYIHGFSYSLHVSGDIMDHFFWWYMVSNYSYEDKYMGRKNDLTIETLNKIAETAPDIAERLFSYYDECFGCGANCSAKTVYKYPGNKKVVCHGKMIMNMKNSTFQDLQIMFKTLNDILMVC